MSKSPLSMPRPGWLMSSHSDHWHSSPQPGWGETEVVEGVGQGHVPVAVEGALLRMSVCGRLVVGLGCVPGGPVELMTEGREGREAKRQGLVLTWGSSRCPPAIVPVRQLPVGVTMSVCMCVSVYDGSLGRASNQSPDVPHTWQLNQ